MSRVYICGGVNSINIRGAFVCDESDYSVKFLTAGKLAGLDIEGNNSDDFSLIEVQEMNPELRKTIDINDTKRLIAGVFKANIIGTSSICPIIYFEIKVPEALDLQTSTGNKYEYIKFCFYETYDEYLGFGLTLRGGYSYDYVDFTGFSPFYFVDEFRYKLSISSESELKQVILDYFGGIRNLMRVVLSSKAAFKYKYSHADQIFISSHFKDYDLVRCEFFKGKEYYE